jgi:hypothetical protein
MKLSGYPIVRVKLASVVTTVAMVAALLPALALAAAPAAQAAPSNDLTVTLVNARSVAALVDGAAIPTSAAFKWLITADDTGNPADTAANCVPAKGGADPVAPGSTVVPLGFSSDYVQSKCQWPSIRNTPGAVPVVTQGDSTATGQDLRNDPLTLPVGRYLISVLADGYTIGGAHFTVPLTAPVTVRLQPNPVPLATMKIQVFQDTVPVDGTYEADAERGIAGFEAHLSDVLGEVTTDWFGNPLCTNYLHDSSGRMQFSDGSPIVDPGNPGGHCVSDATGLITVPNLGSNRYGVTLSHPKGSTWVQTTTLEGSHDHDVWLMNNATGLDTEMVVAGEPVPWVQFGYVPVKNGGSPSSVTADASAAHIKGRVRAGQPYVGGSGGIVLDTAGGRPASPIAKPWIALSDLNNGDQMVYSGRGNADGTFDLSGVPDGSYQLTAWDDNQDYIIYSYNVTVTNHQTVATGDIFLTGWVAVFRGTVFIDTNENGKRDDGEAGVPGLALTLRERDNSLMDQFQNLVTTDDQGRYQFTEAYPLTKWLVMENFQTRYTTTGITIQGDNELTERTMLGSAVDINVLPVLGLGGRIDWGVKPYDPGANGGIAGTVSYDTTRNETDPAVALSEDYQPGIPGIKVHLYGVETDPITGDVLYDADGSVKKGPELSEATTSETWAPPKGCTAYQWDGSRLTGIGALPDMNPANLGTNGQTTCVESPMMGLQAMPSDNTDGGFNAQTVNGNYGFGESNRNQYEPGDPDNPAPNHDLPLWADLATNGYPAQPLVAGMSYVVSVEIPQDAYGRPLYQATQEEDVNVFDGDSYLPQENFPVTGTPSTGGTGVAPPADPPEAPPSGTTGPVTPCAGPLHTVHVTNQNFIDNGGSPFEGQDRPMCTDKLVTVKGQQAVAPNFNLFTPVPLPTHFWGLTINDLGLTLDKNSIQYGEAQGLPNVPMGIYDWSGNLVDTTTTDPNGYYEAIEPSTSSFNCPLPAGPCPGMYRFVGNDPGQPGAPNASYNPRFRTIAAEFQAWPGLFTVTDTAPTQVASVITLPSTTTPVPVDCTPNDLTPQVYSVTNASDEGPLVRGNGGSATRRLLIRGVHLTNGSSTPSVTLTDAVGNVRALNDFAGTNPSDSLITVQVPTNVGVGQFQLDIDTRVTDPARKSQGASINGGTVHVLGTGYSPTVRHVGPGRAYGTIQAAIDAPGSTNTIVMVHPGATSAFNPSGAYLENVILHKRIKLQGFGPGGPGVPGSVIDGQGFDADGASGTAWYTLLGSLNVASPTADQTVPDGAAITVVGNESTYANPTGTGSYFNAAIDGFRITGGYQQNIPGNLNELTGAINTGFGAEGAQITQGGGIYVHAYVRNLQISNNVIIGNSGSYGGGIRVGTPYAGNAHNDRIRIRNNQIRDNGGTNLAGGVGLFDGSNGYEVDSNALCGNFSAEYGGGLSHFGLNAVAPAVTTGGNRPTTLLAAKTSSIHDNLVYFNTSYDEGGGMMIAGELPANPDNPSPGSGPVNVSGNEIVLNTANDDGGGLRLLQVGNFPIRVENTILADNMSTHEGGGIALDDAPDVTLVNSTIARNITTATAITSDGSPAAAGLSYGLISSPLYNSLPTGSATYSKPNLVNDIFWSNMAGRYDAATGVLTGIGTGGDADRNFWDIGSLDGSPSLELHNSVYSSLTGITADASNFFADPAAANPVQFKLPYQISADISTLRAFPGFRQAVMIVQNLPAGLVLNYHLTNGSPATDLGRAVVGAVTAPPTDIDGDRRYPGTANANNRLDAGADELP